MAAAKRVDFDLDRNGVVDSMDSVGGSRSVNERAFSAIIVNRLDVAKISPSAASTESSLPKQSLSIFTLTPSAPPIPRRSPLSKLLLRRCTTTFDSTTSKISLVSTPLLVGLVKRGGIGAGMGNRGVKQTTDIDGTKYADFLREVGTNPQGIVEIPPPIGKCDSLVELLSIVYPRLDVPETATPDYLIDRAILSARNDDVNAINAAAL
ncbi:hypothetical protein Droror1_Dr00008265 [Drosera rotundifolia]